MTFKVARSNPNILKTHKIRYTSDNLRIAISISKKVSKKAVHRNKIRRTLQEWLLTNIEKINNHKPYWLLVNLKFGDFCNDKNQLLEEFQNLMYKSNLIK
jgi:ribonuclease P protein component